MLLVNKSIWVIYRITHFCSLIISSKDKSILEYKVKHTRKLKIQIISYFHLLVFWFFYLGLTVIFYVMASVFGLKVGPVTFNFQQTIVNSSEKTQRYL